MTREAELRQTPEGLVPATPGWFVTNLARSRWFENERFGAVCRFEGEHLFTRYGINVRVLQPGQPNCYYHRENLEESFLVLEGECLLIVQGEERRLGKWDFFHSPPETDHVFVATGAAPCVILMVGARGADKTLFYPVAEVAKAHGAGVQVETDKPQEAYADAGSLTPAPAPPPFGAAVS